MSANPHPLPPGDRELEALARAAQERNARHNSPPLDWHTADGLRDYFYPEDAAYIAACSPAVALSLYAAVAALTEQRDDLQRRYDIRVRAMAAAEAFAEAKEEEHAALLARVTAGAADTAKVREIDMLYPRAEYHEDEGPVLWWFVPISEPPYCGSLGNDDFPEYMTHWSRLHVPKTIVAPEAEIIAAAHPVGDTR